MATKKSKSAKQATKKPAKKATLAKKKAAPKKTKLAQIKTRETSASVEGYLKKLGNEQQRKDSLAIIDMMKKASGDDPKLWGSAIIGFGNIIYTSPNSGRQVEWMKVGFAPRKTNITLYLMGAVKQMEAELPKLGKYKTGGGCLYIKKLEDVDAIFLQKLIDVAVKKGYQY